MNNEFLSGLSLGAIVGVILPILLRHWLQKNEDRKKSICKKCDDAAEHCHKIMKASALLYCSSYNRDKSVELKTDFRAFGSIIQQLNNDLGFEYKNKYEVNNSLVINFRQAVTNELFSLREIKYNYSDPLINSINNSGEAIVEKLKVIARELR